MSETDSNAQRRSNTSSALRGMHALTEDLSSALDDVERAVFDNASHYTSVHRDIVALQKIDFLQQVVADLGLLLEAYSKNDLPLSDAAELVRLDHVRMRLSDLRSSKNDAAPKNGIDLF
ncbi:MAG: hypothetical protein AAGG57_11490 [Pseudomonadota bacterium]